MLGRQNDPYDSQFEQEACETLGSQGRTPTQSSPQPGNGPMPGQIAASQGDSNLDNEPRSSAHPGPGGPGLFRLRSERSDRFTGQPDLWGLDATPISPEGTTRPSRYSGFRVPGGPGGLQSQRTSTHPEYKRQPSHVAPIDLERPSRRLVAFPRTSESEYSSSDASSYDEEAGWLSWIPEMGSRYASVEVLKFWGIVCCAVQLLVACLIAFLLFFNVFQYDSRLYSYAIVMWFVALLCFVIGLLAIIFALAPLLAIHVVLSCALGASSAGYALMGFTMLLDRCRNLQYGYQGCNMCICASGDSCETDDLRNDPSCDGCNAWAAGVCADAKTGLSAGITYCSLGIFVLAMVLPAILTAQLACRGESDCAHVSNRLAYARNKVWNMLDEVQDMDDDKVKKLVKEKEFRPLLCAMLAYGDTASDKEGVDRGCSALGFTRNLLALDMISSGCHDKNAPIRDFEQTDYTDSWQDTPEEEKLMRRYDEYNDDGYFDEEEERFSRATARLHDGAGSFYVADTGGWAQVRPTPSRLPAQERYARSELESPRGLVGLAVDAHVDELVEEEAEEEGRGRGRGNEHRDDDDGDDDDEGKRRSSRRSKSRGRKRDSRSRSKSKSRRSKSRKRSKSKSRSRSKSKSKSKSGSRSKSKSRDKGKDEGRSKDKKKEKRKERKKR